MTFVDLVVIILAGIVGAFVGLKFNKHSWLTIGLGIATALPIGWAINERSGWYLLAIPLFLALLLLRHRKKTPA